METRSARWQIETINSQRRRINPKPPYQRGSVWSQARKQLLIDSVIRGFDCPSIYLRKLDSTSPFGYEVIDGQQRLDAIWGFLENEFPLGRHSVDVSTYGDSQSLYYRYLPDCLRDEIRLYEITVVEIHGGSDVAVRQMFQRLQAGARLTVGEKSIAMQR